jgi:hypothetical protein
MFHVEQFESKGSCDARLLKQAGQFYGKAQFILGPVRKSCRNRFLIWFRTAQKKTYKGFYLESSLSALFLSV